MGHVLSHRADIVVVLCVIVKVLNGESVVFQRLVLLFVEIVVFDKCCYVMVLQKCVVFFAAVSRVGRSLLQTVGIRCHIPL